MRPGTSTIYVLIGLFGYAYRPVQGHIGCGFPGSPAHGSVMPHREQYNASEIIDYHCDNKYELDGPKRNTCRGNQWSIPVLPLCLQDLARGRETYQSTFTSEKHNAALVVDGNDKTCSQTTEGDRIRSWEVSLSTQHKVHKVIIDAMVGRQDVSLNLSVKVGNHRLDSKAKECFSYAGSGKYSHRIEQFCSNPIKGQVVSVTDIRRGDYINWRLQLCEVKVFAVPDLQCGEPDNTPFCKVEKIPRSDPQKVKYRGKAGYALDGDVERTCDGGKWTGSAPKCTPSTPGKQTISFTTVPTKSTGGTENNSSNTLDNGFVIGIAIGVTAASVSTIIVVIILVVVLRKYYKRAGPQSVTVTSETDSVFLRGNLPSSSDSGSPHVRQTYSDPWDDPKYHVYDYICEETLQQLEKPSVEETSFIPASPPIDSGGYVTNAKRHRSDRTNGSGSASEKLLTPLNVQNPQILFPESSDAPSPPRRVCSYNELEVDAYGYQDPADVVRV